MESDNYNLPTPRRRALARAIAEQSRLQTCSVVEVPELPKAYGLAREIQRELAAEAKPTKSKRSKKSWVRSQIWERILRMISTAAI